MTEPSGLRAAVSAGVLPSEDMHRALLKSIVEVARAIFSSQGASIFLLDEDTDELVFEAVANPDDEHLVGQRFPSGQGVAGWVLVCVQAVPLLTQYTLVASQEAVQDDDLPEALDQALAARQLSPWASSPYLQLALVHEQGDDLQAARAAIGEAIERDPLNWRLWLVRARLETLDGEVAAARESLARAVELNPRSPLFANAG